ncbi:MAG: hypothetical protein AB1558_10730, partial [Thermodesulfobacteriota bacterium]
MNRELPPLPSPGGYEQAHTLSLGIALEKLRQADLAEICRRSGADPAGADAVRLSFLDREHV